MRATAAWLQWTDCLAARASLELSDEQSTHMHERIGLLEESRQAQLEAQLAHKAVVSHMMSGTASVSTVHIRCPSSTLNWPPKISRFRSYARRLERLWHHQRSKRWAIHSLLAHRAVMVITQVLTPIKRMMQSKQAEVPGNPLRGNISSFCCCCFTIDCCRWLLF